MNLKNYLTYQSLFQINSAYISPAEKLFLFAGAILVLLSIVMKIAGKLAPTPVDKKYRQKFFNLFLTIGLGELLWYLWRFENIRFFGTHFVALVVVLIGIIWFAAILVSFFRHYGTEKKNWEKQQLKLKYLQKVE